MRPGSCKHELQLLLLHTVNDEPVTLDVDFAVSFPISGQRMVAVFCAEQLFVLGHERVDGLSKLIGIVMLFKQSLEILFELRCAKNRLKHPTDPSSTHPRW